MIRWSVSHQNGDHISRIHNIMYVSMLWILSCGHHFDEWLISGSSPISSFYDTYNTYLRHPEIVFWEKLERMAVFSSIVVWQFKISVYSVGCPGIFCHFSQMHWIIPKVMLHFSLLNQHTLIWVGVQRGGGCLIFEFYWIFMWQFQNFSKFQFFSEGGRRGGHQSVPSVPTLI